MTKSQRLKPIIKLSDNRQQDAARAVAESKRILEEHQDRLADLERYRDEYAARFKAMGAGGMVVSQLHEYRAFLSNLAAAVTQQEKLVLISRQDLDGKIRLWNQARGKARALDVVVIKYRQEEQRIEGRREQILSDEQAQRLNRKKNDRKP
ncbi:MAG: flagellar export protein FliJ [Pseudomonadota bacterium]